MIYLGNGEYKLEKDEPVRTGCWLCQPAHDFLQLSGELHKCYTCHRLFIYDTFLDELKTTKEWDAFVEEKGIKTQKKKKKTITMKEPEATCSTYFEPPQNMEGEDD